MRAIPINGVAAGEVMGIAHASACAPPFLRRPFEQQLQITPEMIQASKTYAQHMVELKQIKQVPDFSAFFNPVFSDELGHA